jgi:hypothetical protein
VSADSIPAQLRRRRAAADRLPPLENGRRDPLDLASRSPYPSTLKRDYKAASVTLDEQRGIALVRGHKAGDVIKFYAIPTGWSRSGRGWVVDGQYVDDLVAQLEVAGYHVTYREQGGAA